MIVMGKEVKELGSNPRVEDLIIGQRYLVDDLESIKNHEFYLDNALFEHEEYSEGVSSGVLRYIGDGTKTPDKLGYKNFLLVNTFDGDDYDE